MKTMEIKNRIKFSLLRDEPKMNKRLSGEIANGTINFLEMCGKYKVGLVPSTLIDKGWHCFILYTPEYKQYCEEKFNTFLHHRPNFNGKLKTSSLDTVKFMKKHHIKFNKKLWIGNNKSGACTPYCGKGCRCMGMKHQKPCSTDSCLPEKAQRCGDCGGCNAVDGCR